MRPPPAGVPWRLTLRLPSTPRAPAAMAGPRGRIDLSTLRCQQPLGHNLTWKRVEPHPHGSPVWRMRRRVRVYAAQTLRGEGDTLHEERLRQAQKTKKKHKKNRTHLRNWAPAMFNFWPKKYALTRWKWKVKWALPYSGPTSLNSSKCGKESSQHSAPKTFTCPPFCKPSVERSRSGPWQTNKQKQNKTRQQNSWSLQILTYSPWARPRAKQKVPDPHHTSSGSPSLPLLSCPAESRNGGEQREKLPTRPPGSALRLRTSSSLSFPQKHTHIRPQSPDAESHLKAEKA